MKPTLLSVATRAWRALSGRWQWRLLHLTRPTFLVGVCMVITDPDDRVLALRHRFYPAGREWGLPAGYLTPGETIGAGAARELAEEVGLTGLTEVSLIGARSGFRMRVELMITGTAPSQELRPDGTEVLEASWLDQTQARDLMAGWQQQSWSRHREGQPGLDLS